MTKRNEPSGLGQFLSGIEGLINLVKEVTEQGVIAQTGEIRNLPKGARGMYGFSIKTIAGGLSQANSESGFKVRSFAAVSEAREPLVDIFDEKDRVLVVVEIPGVAAENISVEIRENILKLRARDGDRTYIKDVVLPPGVKCESLATAYRNGILEISIDKG
ncbi:MAG: Hsp20 family protein [Candidatus Fermentithermobacillus carboniphilus]|uniref:Hsp20 family protein n=1 Tax=Candidatus Fermentithermobacillus carboniphilus TaxID=3085328 RepID=A0AAT9LE02_9FIRM|nr:MAG: Hsp20 family protein [Candidatus Fermentithermobacillus carboniphilus]